MPVRELGSMTWEEIREADPGGAVAILPIGALEAHGPHLPMDVDVIIARAMAREGGRLLERRIERPIFLLPPVVYSPAPFAAGFPGTVSIRPATLGALLRDLAESLGREEMAALVLANAHLDPAHVQVLRRLEGDGPMAGRDGVGLRIVFPDVTRRAVAGRLTEEFLSGACHAGCYETSIVLAEAPEAVREELRRGLEPVPHSLSEGFREGKRTFEEVGGPRAYFGDPAAATAEEGRRTVAVLGEILADAVVAALRTG